MWDENYNLNYAKYGRHDWHKICPQWLKYTAPIVTQLGYYFKEVWNTKLVICTGAFNYWLLTMTFAFGGNIDLDDDCLYNFSS